MKVLNILGKTFNIKTGRDSSLEPAFRSMVTVRVKVGVTQHCKLRCGVGAGVGAARYFGSEPGV